MKFRLFFLLFLTLIGCSNKEDEPDINCTVSFKNEIEPIFRSACSISGCHVEGFASGNFINYDSIKTYTDDGRIWFRVGVTRTMPPSIDLYEEDIMKLKIWIDEGAKNN